MSVADSGKVQLSFCREDGLVVLLSYERRPSVTKMDILIIHVNVMIIILQYYHRQASKMKSFDRR